MCWRGRELKDERRGFNVLSRDCSWRACALAVNVPPHLKEIHLKAASQSREGAAHRLLEVSLPQRFCPDEPRIPGRKGISQQLRPIGLGHSPDGRGHFPLTPFFARHRWVPT